MTVCNKLILRSMVPEDDEEEQYPKNNSLIKIVHLGFCLLKFFDKWLFIDTVGI